MTQPAHTYAEHARATMALGGPLIASNLAMFAIHMIDTIMLGWYDVTALAAATVATSLFFLVFIVGGGFGQAVTPLVAAAEEEGDETQVRRVTRMGLWLSVLYGAIVTVPFFQAERLFLAMGQKPEIAALAHDYLVVAILGMIPALLVMTLKSYLAALEHTGAIFWATVIGGVLNVILNYAFIFGNLGAPELGIKGAAIASVCAHALTLATMLGYSLKVLPQFDLLRNLWKPDWEILTRVFRLGYPIGATSLAEGGLFSISSIMMGWIGTIELAAHGIALQWASLMFVMHIGLSQAATVRAGRALGRKDRLGLARGGQVVILLSLGVVLLTTAFFFLIPEFLISVFVAPDEPNKAAVIKVGVVLLAMAALFQLADAMQVIALGLLRGVQDTAVPMLMAVISYWIIGLPVGYLLAFHFDIGPVGLWLGLVTGLSIAAVLLMFRFWRGQGRYIPT